MRLLSIASLLLLTGCFSFGSHTMLNGHQPFAPTVIDQVAIYSEPPKKPYTVIALVRASASTDDFLSSAHAEEATLKQLRTEAAQIGADGIIEIQGRKDAAGALGSSNRFGSAYGSGNSIYGSSHGSSYLDVIHEISLTARAIRFD